MSTKHTPGPWHAVTIGTLAFISQALDDEFRFSHATVHFPNYHPDGLAAARVEQSANCSLIAAAPDMLEALESVIRQVEPLLDKQGYAYIGALQSARAAIARAKGQA
jgi:hypothetical protein